VIAVKLQKLQVVNKQNKKINKIKNSVRVIEVLTKYLGFCLVSG
jgi:hypothetical protein